MAKIPGIVFIGVGLLLSLASFIINRNQQSGSLTLFLYLGFAFIAFGAARTFFSYKHPKDKLEELSKPVAHSHKHHAGKAKKPHHLHGYIGKCSGCGTPMREINVYCHRCGLKQELSHRRQ